MLRLLYLIHDMATETQERPRVGYCSTLYFGTCTNVVYLLRAGRWCRFGKSPVPRRVFHRNHLLSRTTAARDRPVRRPTVRRLAIPSSKLPRTASVDRHTALVSRILRAMQVTSEPVDHAASPSPRSPTKAGRLTPSMIVSNVVGRVIVAVVLDCQLNSPRFPERIRSRFEKLRNMKVAGPIIERGATV